ncbi:MAG: hypothetical protein BWX80_04146 [Candidatus Hydrogenedentes bacterium ADurb.Bin101]|nr:MAG: hypothetical protein BWX80_04146 [Candidatus Hydrogenedentes bacterium ADurb.Bin101]
MGKSIETVKGLERLDNADNQQEKERGRQQRQHNVPQQAHADSAVDTRRLFQLARYPAQSGKENHDHEAAPVPDIKHHNTGQRQARPPGSGHRSAGNEVEYAARLQQPLLGRSARIAQQKIEDAALRVKQAAPHQGRSHGGGHVGQEIEGAQESTKRVNPVEAVSDKKTQDQGHRDNAHHIVHRHEKALPEIMAAKSIEVIGGTNK